MSSEATKMAVRSNMHMDNKVIEVTDFIEEGQKRCQRRKPN